MPLGKKKRRIAAYSRLMSKSILFNPHTAIVQKKQHKLIRIGISPIFFVTLQIGNQFRSLDLNLMHDGL